MTAATKRGASTYGQVAGKLAGVDAIEIKVTIQDRQIDAVLSRYKLTIDNDEERFIYLFDTPSLDLFKAGLIARARRIVGEEDDSTVKFRPVVPYEVPKSWRRFAGFKLEADAGETGVVKSASLTMPVEKGLINQVVTGGKNVATLFTQEQEDFLASIGKQHIDYNSLSVLGPLHANRWKFEDPACPWRMTAELWEREDDARLMEISIKTPVVQAAAAIAGFMAFLAEAGVGQDLKQQTKTRWALQYYADLFRKKKKTGSSE